MISLYCLRYRNSELASRVSALVQLEGTLHTFEVESEYDLSGASSQESSPSVSVEKMSVKKVAKEVSSNSQSKADES